MNQALFIISLQHELSMLIGSQLDLSLVCKRFLKVCNHRMSLNSCHVILKNQNKLFLPNWHATRKDLIYSMPKRFEGAPWTESKLAMAQLDNILENHNRCEQAVISKQSQLGVLTSFRLKDLGYLILHTQVQVRDELVHSLLPITEKLANFCYSCCIQQQLVAEMQAREQAEHKIKHQATHDSLTNLYNREHISVLIQQIAKHAETNGTQSALIFTDLNNFKPINDTMGHAMGDQILIQVAYRLHRLKNNKIHIARFGGDEFIIVVSDLAQSVAEARSKTFNFIEQVQQLFSLPIRVQAKSYQISMSIGFCLFPYAAKTPADAITFADIAMYEAKRSKISAGIEYSPSMSEILATKAANVEIVKQALANNGFALFYQAQYHANKQLIGAEALIRWNHSSNENSQASEIIGIAEENNLILQIGDWVLDAACGHIAQLERRGLPTYFDAISINISPKQLITDNFFEKIQLLLKKHKIQNHHLKLEITENILIENFDQIVPVIKALKSLGVQTSIDDFGTGYSSLTYLKSLPVDELKIDRNFVVGIHNNPESQAIAQMIIALGNTLNMQVLAEGIEDEAELICLKALGCHLFQGYYFAKPAPFEHLAGSVLQPI
ncbi:putative bifunctional diguanylate cyclase/phosphodiesterase [Gayadomonas joobiniege]|uniref:putative bifunctional diguanylate cyclase/phosphodiesterase n=1 Tax=Gayadomonas joobiniege TaxID=1234606 RepID=UPI00037C9C71|nr:bifunctional diguanylate cyclase/phosphodiesterase [Gayadomonas joobiniege]